MTGSQLPPRTTARRVCRAVVHAGPVATEYLRAGSGPAVLYLRNAGAPDAEGDAMFEALASGFRVYAPQPAPPDSGFTQWIGGFLDGLGILRASLVVDESFGTEALDFASANPTQVDRLLVLTRESSIPDALRALSNGNGG